MQQSVRPLEIGTKTGAMGLPLCWEIDVASPVACRLDEFRLAFALPLLWCLTCVITTLSRAECTLQVTVSSHSRQPPQQLFEPSILYTVTVNSVSICHSWNSPKRVHMRIDAPPS